MTYNMYQNYYQPQYQGFQNVQNQDGRIWVQGEVGAKAYLVATNNTVTLWDSEKPIIYVKSVSANGMPTMQILTYSVMQEQKEQKVDMNNYVTKDYLERKLEEMKNEQSNANDARISEV